MASRPLQTSPPSIEPPPESSATAQGPGGGLPPLESPAALPAAEPAITEAAAPPRKNWGRLALRGSVLEILGYGASQVIRLGSNLLLTRLLFPEAFGLAALVSIFLQGLIMLSDVGIQQAVVQSDQGDDEEFLNTAWTLQAVRGVILFVAASVLAYPVSRLYGEPVLFPLLIVAAVQLLISGLHSTSIFTLRRQVALGWITLLELGNQVINVAVMVTWALISPSVWALIAGGVTATVAYTVATHFIPVGYRNRFAWNQDARKKITEFGRWIFGSSAVFFLGRQGDRLLLGKFLGAATLGVYSIAVFLSEAVGVATERVTHGVFYSIFSNVRHEGYAELKRIYYRSRIRLDLLALPAMGGLTMLGSWVVSLLWDERYEAAGWMLQILSLRVAMNCILTPCETCLSALGKPHHGFVRSVVKTAVLLVGIPIGYHLDGLRGLVWATALSELPSFLVLWPPFIKLGLFRATRELLAFALYGVGLVLGWAFGLVFL